MESSLKENFLPLRSSFFKHPNHAQITLQSYMHFPGYSKSSKDFNSAKSHSKREEATLKIAEESRKSYIYYLASRKLNSARAQKSQWLYRDDDDDESQYRMHIEMTNQEMDFLRLGRNFHEICVDNMRMFGAKASAYTRGIATDSIKFYKYAFLASHCLLYYSHLMEHGETPVAISFKSWEDYIAENVIPVLDSKVFVSGQSPEDVATRFGTSADIEELPPSVANATWASTGPVLKQAVMQFAPVLHLWCALLMTGQVLNKLAPSDRGDIRRGRKIRPVYAGRIFDLSTTNPRGGMQFDKGFLSRAYRYQQLMIEGYELTKHHTGNGPWITQEKMWLIQPEDIVPRSHVKQGPLRAEHYHPWLAPVNMLKLRPSK